MYRIQDIIDLDKHLLLSMNGGESLFIDGCIGVFTMPIVWVPMLLTILYVLIKNNSAKDFISIMGFMAAMLGVAYFVTEYALQPFFDYLRTLYGADSLNLLNAMNEYRATNGFLLTHATLAFSAALFLALLIRHMVLTFSLLLWALIGCYTGLYMAVNYPWDILTGALLGVICALVTYRLYIYMQDKQRRSRRDWISDRFTRSGYEVPDVYRLLVVMYATFAAIPVISFFLI